MVLVVMVVEAKKGEEGGEEVGRGEGAGLEEEDAFSFSQVSWEGVAEQDCSWRVP